MPTEVYEVVAQAARYWFLFLMVLIVWRSYRWYRKDQKQRKKRLKLLPDAGFVGELVLLSGNDDIKRGTVLLVPWEGTLGFSRTNDLCIPIRGVSNKHLWFRFDNGDGLMVEAFRGCQLRVDDEEIKGGPKPLYMAHGSRLFVGDAELRLRLFAGFEAPARSMQHSVRVDSQENQEERATAPPDMTNEQIAMMQQMWMQQQMMNQYQQQQIQQQQAQQITYQQQAYAQWMAQQQAEQYEEQEPEYLEDENGGVYANAKAATTVDYSAYKRPPGSPSYEPTLAVDLSQEDYDAPHSNEIVFETDDEFYPLEEGGDDNWSYAPYPQSKAQFEDQGYTYPEYVESEHFDEDMTDAAAPPKSAYVGHDDAELAKKKLWDKYLGGGQKR